ncbi:NAD(P)/FAD-dependent oxidoreductase [Amaricoccus macauensis]|uniref:NAD(P)/FAD-dependent oxidoreductase n=1 Tax=Amaricoccus macauensis TaxID=57001 RepID=UPI003C7A178F
MSKLPYTCDVLIIGGGPAGLSAAAELRRLGVASVHVLDREEETGGIPRHCAHSPYGFREFRRPMLGPAFARALSDRARASGAILHTRATATEIKPGGIVAVSSPEGFASITARAVLLATGVRESSRAARLLGGTKPAGVLNTGSLQGLVHLTRTRPFRRPVVVGTELVSFSALLTCRQAGIRPVAMVEPGERLVARSPLRLLPAALGIPLRLATELTAIHGRDQVNSVTLSRGNVIEDVECDGVLLTGKFRPENALLRTSHLQVDPHTLGPEIDPFGRCSDPTYFAAGNLLRAVETAGWCWSEGRAVARSIQRSLIGRLPDHPKERRLTIVGDGLAWALPQRSVDLDSELAFNRLQLHVSRPVKGTLRVGSQSYSLNARPERRIAVPLPPAQGDVVVEIV